MMNSSSSSAGSPIPATPDMWEEWLRMLIPTLPSPEWLEENFTLRNIERLCALPHTQEQATAMAGASEDIRWVYTDDETITAAADDLINRLAAELP